MGDATASNPLNTPFPLPPSFYQHFTAENISQLQSLEKEHGGQHSIPTSELSESLRYLRPPTPPTNGIYHSFGEERSLDAPLSVLPPETRILPPPAPEEATKATIPSASPPALLTLTRSILLSILEFIHILQANPDSEQYNAKWLDLRDLFWNAHAIVNAYRGWQGREALITLLEAEVKRGKDSVREWATMDSKVNDILKGLREGEGKSDADLNGNRPTASRKSRDDEDKLVWDMISKEA